MLTAARRLARAAAALVCGAAVAAGLTAAGCGAGARGRRGWRLRAAGLAAAGCGAVVAAGLAAAGCGASPAAAGAPVPARAIPRLTLIADRAAKASGDAAPAWMTAVLTTHAKALTSATPGDFVPGGGVRVFLVTMRGHFVANGAPGPSGAAAPTGRYLSLVVDATTFLVLDSGLSPAPPPVSPASLGPVTYLAGRGHG
jgi:hypothetical protein